ncbi:hypothetical protein A2U01_0062633, partial [Trifolium medium]|nr:hypothetical protein [Trifolium medium]
PREIRENSRTDKNKFCRYHKSPGHDIEDCIQLKDAIEDLIKLGKLNRYTKMITTEVTKRGSTILPEETREGASRPKESDHPRRNHPPRRGSK